MLNTNVRLPALFYNLERPARKIWHNKSGRKWSNAPVLLILLNFRIADFTTNQTFCVKDSVFGIRVEGILGAVANSDERKKSTGVEMLNTRLTIVHPQ